MREKVSETLVLLTAKTKLDRDRGYRQLNDLIVTLDADEIVQLETFLLDFIGAVDESASINGVEAGAAPNDVKDWERLLGLASGAGLLNLSGQGGEEFAEKMIEPSMTALTHAEVRVREKVGWLLGTIAARWDLWEEWKLCRKGGGFERVSTIYNQT